MIYQDAKKISVTQGTHRVTENENVLFAAILGSCVAVCAFDPMLKAGGMNHILLPGGQAGGNGTNLNMYGANLMELLLNDLYKLGASKSTLELKLFGGARVLSTGANIGQENIDFLLQFVELENLKVVSQSLGGEKGRRIEFHPTTGRTRQKFLNDEVKTQRPPMAEVKPENSGTLELF